MSNQISDKDAQNILNQAQDLKKSLEKVDLKGKLNTYKDYLAELANKHIKSMNYKVRPRKSGRKTRKSARKSTRKSVRKSKRKSFLSKLFN